MPRFKSNVLIVTVTIGALAQACRTAATTSDTRMHAVTLGACTTVLKVQSPVAARIPSGAIIASGSSTVVGTVLDEGTRVPLNRAVVRFQQGTENHTVITDSAGGFVGAGLLPGPYIVHIIHVGFTPATDTIRLRSDAIDTLAYLLEYYSCP